MKDYFDTENENSHFCLPFLFKAKIDKVPSSSKRRWNACELGAVQGQVEAEAVIAFGLLLLFFVAVSFLFFQRNNEIFFLKSQTDSLSECQRIAFVIDSFSSSESFDEIFLVTENDFNVGERTVYVNDFFCGFFGKAQLADLNAGTVRVFEENNEVVFENV